MFGISDGWQNIIVISLILLLIYIVDCWRNRYRICLWCSGQSKVFGTIFSFIFGNTYRFRSCWWCHGAPRRRYAARLFGWE